MDEGIIGENGKGRKNKSRNVDENENRMYDLNFY